MAGIVVEPHSLALLVEIDDRFIGRRHEQRSATDLAFGPPAGDGLLPHPLERSTVESTVMVVPLGDLYVATTESEAGVTFPVVVEAVDSVEFDGLV